MFVAKTLTRFLSSVAGLAQRNRAPARKRQLREHHVIIALAEGLPTRLIEKACEICDVYRQSEIVLLVPKDLETLAAKRRCPGSDVIVGSIYSAHSWLTADAARAFQIVILSERKLELPSLKHLKTTLSKRAPDKRVLILT